MGFALYCNKQLVEFAGKTLPPAVSNYDIHDKELTAALYGVMRFRMYIARSSKCTVHIDNDIALGYLKRANECQGRSLRIVNKILQFPRLEFVRVVSAANASDLPSRMCWKREDLADQIVTVKTEVNPDKIAKHTSKCEDLIQQCHVDEDHVAFFFETVGQVGFVADGLMANPRDVAVLCHRLFGHCAVFRLKKLLSFAAPNMKFPESMLKEILAECEECSEQKRELPKSKITKRWIPEKPGDLVSIDHFTFTQCKDEAGFIATLTIRDEFSKHVLSCPVKSYSIEEALHHIRLYIVMLGNVSRLHADNFFQCKTLQDYCDNEDIQLTFSPVASPTGNGSAERVHRQFRFIFPIVLEKSSLSNRHWSEASYITAKILNLTPSSVHGYPPIVVLRGCLSADIFRSYSSPEPLETIWKKVRTSLIRRQEGNINLPSKNQGKGRILPPGTRVMFYSGVDGKRTYLAKVLVDHGVSCLIEKEGKWTRFGVVLAHKSRLRVL